MSIGSNGVVLEVDDLNGQLVGAYNIGVNNRTGLYDVTFLSDTFENAHPNGVLAKDMDESFEFSWALAIEVFYRLGFDNKYGANPELTNGCEGENYCFLFTAHQEMGTVDIELWDIVNLADDYLGNGGSFVDIGVGNFNVIEDATNVRNFFAWAVWSESKGLVTAAVTEPSSLAVLLLGFIGLIMNSTKSKKSQLL